MLRLLFGANTGILVSCNSMNTPLSQLVLVPGRWDVLCEQSGVPSPSLWSSSPAPWYRVRLRVLLLSGGSITVVPSTLVFRSRNLTGAINHQRHCPVQSHWGWNGRQELWLRSSGMNWFIFLHRDLFPDAAPYWLHSNCCVYVKLNLWWTISTTLDPIYLRSQMFKQTGDDGYVQAYNSGSIPFHARGPDVL